MSPALVGLTFRTREDLGNFEAAIRAVRNHRLTRLQTKLGAVELYRDGVRFE
jgi:hypothetical protein